MDEKRFAVEGVVNESIESLQRTKEEFGDKWILSDYRSCEQWLKGYFIGMQDKKGLNIALEILKEKLG